MEFESTSFILDEVDSVLDDLVFVTRSTPFQFDTLPVLVDVASGGTATRGKQSKAQSFKCLVGLITVGDKYRLHAKGEVCNQLVL